MTQREWAVARPERDLDPRLCLGELRELPPAQAHVAGVWCRLVVHDHEGEMQWTLVVSDADRDRQFASDLPLAAGGAAPPAERKEPPQRPLPTAAAARPSAARRSVALPEEPRGRGGRNPRAPGAGG